MSHPPNKNTVRSLAAEAKLSVDQALARLQGAGFDVRHSTNKLAGQQLRDAREALGLRAWGDKAPPADRLDPDELAVRLLRPLREKGKLARNYHTEIANVWAHGVPAHQKAEAQDRTEAFLRDGLLEEKRNVGQRHVWMTQEGLMFLQQVELRLKEQS